MSPVDLLRWLASAPPLDEVFMVRDACGAYLDNIARQAAPSAEAAAKRERDEAMISPAQAARELEISRNRPRAWLRAGRVDGWDAASQTAPRAAWRKAASRKPGRPVGAR